jgi:iron complex outermembrane receptor protein
MAQRTVSGTVTDDKTGEALPGVNILIVDTNIGTATDFDGKYTLKNIPENAVIQFSFIGYKTVSVPVNKNVINITMSEDTGKLDEVIVVGYGSAKKEDLTGAVNKVTPKDFNKGAVANAQSLITGKIAGVTVVAPGGAPGEGDSINIRGLSSLSLTNEPLYVVNGVPLGGGVAGSRNPLNLINPNDIESIVVLKDASATAIYGSRAANGVILISTKKGKKNDFSFHYTMQKSTFTPYKYVDVMNAYRFKQIVNETGDANAINLLGGNSTFWQKEIYQTAIGNEHNFSATGQLLHIPVRFAIGYLNQDGILKKDNFERTTVSLNLNPYLLDNHLKIEINATGNYTENQFANRGAIGSAIIFDPTQPVYDSTSPFDGYFTWIDPNTNLQYNLAPVNPVALINLTDDHSYVKRFIGNSKFDYKLHFFNDITATINIGIDKAQSTGHSISSAKLPTSDTSWQGVHNQYTNDNTNKLLNSYLTYTKKIKKNDIKLMAGYSYQSFDYESTYYDDYAYQHGAADYQKIDLSKQVLISYFSRLNYKFNDKYLLTASLRADASSLLNPNDRWGLFPSAAVAWNIHKEKFMENSVFDELKLRAGYGAVGNVNGLSPYKYLTRYQRSTSTANYQFGSEFIQTYRPEPVNKNIRWEVGKTTNIGVDFALWKRRLSGSINLYQKNTDDLIIWSLVDPFTNFGNRVEKNVGNMTNKGIEISLSAIPIEKKDIKWQISYNISFNDNKITYMPFDQQVGGIEGGVGNTVQLHKENYAPYGFYVYQQVYDSNGKPIEGVYVDRNKDGIINNNDKYFYKNPYADVLMGLSTRFNYKNFDISIASRASIGNYVYDNVASSKSIPANLTGRPFLTNLHMDYFQSGFREFTETNLLSDYYVKDASFVKIDYINIGYRFPSIYKNLNLRFFAGLQNVATFTGYKGIDPEIAGGIDNNFYPRPRTFNFGFNLDF